MYVPGTNWMYIFLVEIGAGELRALPHGHRGQAPPRYGTLPNDLIPTFSQTAVCQYMSLVQIRPCQYIYWHASIYPWHRLYRESRVRFFTATEARRHLATVTPYLIGKEN